MKNIVWVRFEARGKVVATKVRKHPDQEKFVRADVAAKVTRVEAKRISAANKRARTKRVKTKRGGKA